MSRVPPLAATTTPELAPLLEQAERAMGYLPNDVLSLCHWPELLQSLGGLVHTVLQTGDVDPSLKRLIGIISSRTQGCTYCNAHSSYGASQLGVDAELASNTSRRGAGSIRLIVLTSRRDVQGGRSPSTAGRQSLGKLSQRILGSIP